MAFCVKNFLKNKNSFLEVLEQVKNLLKNFQKLSKKITIDASLVKNITESLSVELNVKIQDLEFLLSFKKNFLNNLNSIVNQENFRDNVSSIAEFLKKLGAKNPKNLGSKSLFFTFNNTTPAQSSYKLSLFIDDPNFLRKIMEDQFPLSFLKINPFELDENFFEITPDLTVYIKNIHETYIGSISLGSSGIVYNSLIVQSFVNSLKDFSLSQEKDLFPFLYEKNILLSRKKERVNLLYIPLLKEITNADVPFLLFYEVLIKKKDNTIMSGFAIVEEDFFNTSSLSNNLKQRVVAFNLLHKKYNLKKRQGGFPECILLINTLKGLTFVNGSYNITTNEYTLD